MSRVYDVVVAFAVGIPGLLTVGNLNNLHAVTFGESGAEHVLAGSGRVLSELVILGGSPAIEGADKVDTVVAGGLRSGGRLRIGIGVGIIVPAGHFIMTQFILRTVHPVTVIGGEVGDILSLSAIAVAQDNADSAFGNIAAELGLTQIVYDGLSLSSARPRTVELVAVSIPSVYIRGAPTEVIGQQEGTYGIGRAGRLNIRSRRLNIRSRRLYIRSGGLRLRGGLFLADVILHGHLSHIALDDGRVDNGNEAVAVNVSRESLDVSQGFKINYIAQDLGCVVDLNIVVAVRIAEDISDRRFGGGLSGSLVVLIEDCDAGVADVTLDLRRGNGEGVAGDSVLIGAGSQLVVCQRDGLGGGAAEVDDHRAGVASLDVGGTAGVRGAVLGLTDEVVMELVDRLGGRVEPCGHLHIAELDAVQSAGIGVVGRTGEIYGADAVTAGNKRPDLTALDNV